MVSRAKWQQAEWCEKVAENGRPKTVRNRQPKKCKNARNKCKNNRKQANTGEKVRKRSGFVDCFLAILKVTIFQGYVNGGFQTVVWGFVGGQIHFSATPFLPQCYLDFYLCFASACLTSFLTSLNPFSPLFNLILTGNLEPRFGDPRFTGTWI